VSALRDVAISEVRAELSELDRPTCLTLLRTQHVGRLIVDAATPVIRIVNYTAFDHVIMFRSDPGPHVDDIIDHVVVFEERHLRHVLSCYIDYYNAARTHLSLDKDTPIRRVVQSAGRIQAQPVLGGLHHQYARI